MTLPKMIEGGQKDRPAAGLIFRVGSAVLRGRGSGGIFQNKGRRLRAAGIGNSGNNVVQSPFGIFPHMYGGIHKLSLGVENDGR